MYCFTVGNWLARRQIYKNVQVEMVEKYIKTIKFVTHKIYDKRLAQQNEGIEHHLKIIYAGKMKMAGKCKS